MKLFTRKNALLLTAVCGAGALCASLLREKPRTIQSAAFCVCALAIPLALDADRPWMTLYGSAAGAAAYLLRSGGQFCLVHRAERLAELMALLRSYKLEPKELQTVQKTIDTPPRLVLLRCRKDGGTGLDIRPPLLLQNGDGTETEALRRCYFRDRE